TDRAGLVLDPVPPGVRRRLRGGRPVDLRIPGDRMKRALYLAAAAACAVGFAGTLYLAFYQAPLDRLLLFNQKIFYYHVANAFMLFAAVITCGVASLLYLRKRQGRHDDLALAAGELSVMFGAIVLISGSI